MDDQRQSMDMAVEDAHKISFLTGWVAMVEDVEGIERRGWGQESQSEDDEGSVSIWPANISRGVVPGDPISAAVTGGCLRDGQSPPGTYSHFIDHKRLSDQ